MELVDEFCGATDNGLTFNDFGQISAGIDEFVFDIFDGMDFDNFNHVRQIDEFDFDKLDGIDFDHLDRDMGSSISSGWLTFMCRNGRAL